MDLPTRRARRSRHRAPRAGRWRRSRRAPHDESVAQKAGLARAGDDEPRHDGQRTGEDRERERHDAGATRAAGQGPAGSGPREQRNGDPDRALGQRREAQREPGGGPPARRRAVEPPAHQAVERGGDERGERRVEDGESPEDEHDRRGRHDDGGHERPGAPDQDRAERRRQDDRRDRRERGGKARGHLADAEQSEGARHEPEEEHGLVEVGKPVEVRHRPVAAGQHLARDLGVPPFVGVEERPGAEAPGEEEAEQDKQAEARDRAGAHPVDAQAEACGWHPQRVTCR